MNSRVARSLPREEKLLSQSVSVPPTEDAIQDVSYQVMRKDEEEAYTHTYTNRGHLNSSLLRLLLLQHLLLFQGEKSRNSN